MFFMMGENFRKPVSGYQSKRERVKDIKEDFLIRVLTPGVFQRCRAGIGVILGIALKRYG